MRFHFFSIHTPSRTSLFPYTTLFRSEKAGEVGAAIELNADPHRLDLDWRLCRRAKERGVLVEIGPDAHSTRGLDNVEIGVGVARKGWLGPDDILNTRSADDVLAFARSRRQPERRA